MPRDTRWERVRAQVRPWAPHPDWLQFIIEIAPGSLAEGTAVHKDGLAIAGVFGGTLDHMVRDLDSRLETASADELAGNPSDSSVWTLGWEDWEEEDWEE